MDAKNRKENETTFHNYESDLSVQAMAIKLYQRNEFG